MPVAEIARRLDLDRKTIRRCLRDTEWKPYRRAPRSDTLLAPHADYLRERAPLVRYSAQILFQELRQRGHHKAVIAVAHAMLVTASHLLSRETTSQELGADSFDHRQTDRLRRRAVQTLERQGYRGILEPVA